MRKVLPYVIVLAIAIALYVAADGITYVAPGGRIGPAFWPKAILVLAMVTCLYEILRTLVVSTRKRKVGGVLQTVIAELRVPDAAATIEGTEPASEERYPHLLAIGIAMTIAYVALIQTLVFALTTFLYLAAFMIVGRYRRPMVILVTSLAGSLLFMFVFMKIVYVSLPLGVEPFSQISIAL